MSFIASSLGFGSDSKVDNLNLLSRLVTTACPVCEVCLTKYFLPCCSDLGCIQQIFACRSEFKPGRFSKPTSMSPRLISISSSRQIVTDCGQNASSKEPSRVQMSLTLLFN